jgi:3-oxoacyl-[acyl-carrier protein] reductase
MSKQKVLVTGASKGIGKGIAEIFAKNGCDVAVLARDLATAEQTAAELTESTGSKVIAVAADVSNKASVTAAIESAVRQLGGLDVLCANAGIFPSASLEEMTEDDWDTVMNTNLKGTFITVQSVIPALKKSNAGRIIVTSSITGPITGFPGWSHYAASKAGQLGFIRTAAIELAKYNITINAVMPGNILTEGLQEMGDDYLTEMASSIPLKRLGNAADIGHATYFFASEGAGYITGQSLVVDGGQILPESLGAVG